MSIYSNVTEQDLINLRKLAEQQKNQRAIKIKNRILEKTHDKKLAESLSPLTKRLDLIENNKGEKIGDIIKKSESESETLAIENSQTQPETPAIENTQTQPETPAIENIQIQPGVLYEASLENTLTNMKNKEKGFFKITEENGQRFWNGKPVNISGDSRIEIDGINFNVTPDLQNVFTDTTGKSLEKLNKKENRTYKKLLDTLNYKNYKHKPGEKNSGRYKNTKNIIIPINLQGRGIEKIIIPNNIIDIYTRLEVLLGLKLSGHSDTVTKASALIDELFKLGEIQNKQQYRNAMDKFLK